MGLENKAAFMAAIGMENRNFIMTKMRLFKGEKG